MAISIGRTPALFQGRATSNFTMAAAGTWYPIALAQEDRDDADGHSAVTNTSRWTAPFPCTIAVSGVVPYTQGQDATNAGANFRWAAIFKNNVQQPGTGWATYTGAYLSVYTFPGLVVPMNTGDYVELQAASGLANTTVYGTAVLGSLLKVEQIR